jgi:two-component system, NarL family, sensor kinase
VSTAIVVVSSTAATCRVVAHWWARRRTGDSVLLGWLASGSVVALLAVVPEALEFGWEPPAGDVAGSVMLIATVPLLLVGAVVDSLRRRPIGFRGTTHHVLGWTVMAGATAVAYALVVAGLGQVVGGDGPTWLLVAATGVIALAAEPARRRIQRSVDRLVWGARDDPLAVVRHVVDLVGPDSGNDLLPALVRSLQRDLRYDTVAIDVRRDDGWDRVARVGPPSGAEHHVMLEQQDEVVGRLVVASGGRVPVRPRDAQVLTELAGPLALAVGWVRLAGHLRRAGVEVVSAREEERRRIRRDLHDGLGPSLTGVSLGVRTAMRQLERSASGGSLAPTRELLTRAADEIDALVDEVKRIVRDLRPTALDQLGFVDAVTEFARSVSGELDVHVSVPRTPLDLPAVIEVAAYRIVTEAMTNVVRHARAMRCWLTITSGDRVDIDVVDDGVGVDGAEIEGVGWAAMRERVAELGGTFAVGPNAPRGTHLHVELPVALP